MTGNVNLTPQSVFNMTLSGNGPLVVPYVCDMQTVAEIDADLSLLVANGNIDFISGAYIDNSANPETLSIKAAGSNQVITIPAGAQAYMPILAPNEPKFTITSPNVPGVIVPVYFYNIPLLPYMWPQGGGGGAGGGLTDAQLRASPVPVSLGAPVASVMDEVIVNLDGTNQIVVASVTGYFLIQNPAGNNPITLNLAGGNATATGIEILGGGSYELINSLSNSITVAGTNGETVTAYTFA